MSHVRDELELYEVGALPDEDAARVARHLEECEECGAEARLLEEVVAALPDTLAPLAPPPDLLERVMAAAKADRAEERAIRRSRRPPIRARALALAAAFALLLGLNAVAAARLAQVQAEREQYAAIAERFSQGGRWWYMAGADEFGGSGGTLVVPRAGQPPFVLFHDLKPIPEGSVYTLWLIGGDGAWVRGASFRPQGGELQLIELGLDLQGFESCAVTVEIGPVGKRAGPVVMQSRIVAP